MNKKKFSFYSVFICILILLIGVCSYFLYYFYNLKDGDVDTNALVVNEKINMNYYVDLLNDDYNNNSYNPVQVPSNVNTIKGNYNYSVSFDKRVKGEYSYSVTGYLVGKTIDGEKVLNREVYNQPLKKYEADGYVINISDNFIVDYLDDLSIYNSFKNNYGIDVDANILYKVDLYYTVYSEVIKKYVVQHKELELTVSLSDVVAVIETTDNEESSRKEYSEVTAAIKPVYLIICGEFIGAIVLCVFLIIYIVRKMIKSESEFERRRKSIIKKYDANIVHVKELPNLSRMDVIFVDNFKDLVDASNTFNLPIHYVDVVLGHEATFIILNKKRAYVYKLSDTDLRD